VAYLMEDTEWKTEKDLSDGPAVDFEPLKKCLTKRRTNEWMTKKTWPAVPC
jgi:hypothetical protein